MAELDSIWRSATGEQCAVYQWPAEQAAAHLILVHGHAEHLGRYTEVAQVLTGQRISVIGFDLPGHGRSSGRRGDYVSMEKIVTDIFDLGGRLRGLRPEIPLLLLGHSMGGLLALAAAVDVRSKLFDGVVVSSPNLHVGQPVSKVKEIAARILARVTPRLTLPTGTHTCELTHDQQICARTVADPLFHRRLSLRSFLEMERLQQRVRAQADQLTLPSLFLVAGDDRICNGRTTKDFFEQIASRDKTLRWYDGMFHEVFNESDRRIVFNDLCRWVTKRIVSEEIGCRRV